MKLIDLTGQKFSRLTVVERAENSKNGAARWHCICECGNKTIVVGSKLKSGEVKSCGCYIKDNPAHLIHGKSHSKLFAVWNSMLQRCENSNCKSYKWYGARGITVCPDWHEFKLFYDWSISNGYNENAKRGDYTIDRIDVNGNYEPNNCRWISIKEQQKNKTTNRTR